MSVFTPPKYIKSVLLSLGLGGHSAYLVGGCVRDMLLGKRPKDWDICTDALPEEVMSIFPRTIPTGLKHGTVTVIAENRQIEVTTFRKERGYQDHRRPDHVSFTDNLTEDLMRRDFTMNALALPITGLIVDPFGGREDIKNRTIRCVGHPDTRFGEDALRMFRALRFSAQLGFDIEEGTFQAIYRNAHLCSYLAPERISAETEKILMSKRPDILSRVLTFGLLDGFLLAPRASVDLRLLGTLPRNRQQRWAGLCALLEARYIIDCTEKFLRALRLDNSTTRCCVLAVRVALGEPPRDRLGWKHILAEHGIEASGCAAAAADMIQPGSHVKTLKSILRSQECFSIKRLDINGNDLIQLGITGVDTGKALRSLLSYVLKHPRRNKRGRLLELAAEMAQKQTFSIDFTQID